MEPLSSKSHVVITIAKSRPVRTTLNRSDVVETMEELAARLVAERGVSIEKAMARVWRERPELYALYEVARPDPVSALVEKVEERSAIPNFIAERVERLQRRDPGLSTERAVARVLKADPALYRRWCAEDTEEPGDAA